MKRVGAATLLFAAWHSFLCWDGAKNGALVLLGARRGAGIYRAFFVIQALFSTVALVIFILKQPRRVLYDARGWKRILGWAGQLAGLGIMGLGLLELDRAKFFGIAGVRDLKRGEVAARVEAQGPEIGAGGSIGARGIFRFTRHPLEWGPNILLLATPLMKTNWLVFDVLTLIYTVFGAFHEEKRLARQSENYAKYQKQTPFFFGKPRE